MNNSQPFYVGRPNIGNRESFLARVNEILDNRWLSNNGPMVTEFETRVSEILNVKYVVAVSNATTALEIASRALGLYGEVIVPSYTFIATAHALQWQGITPVFCDIHPETHNIDPSLIEQLITPKTTGIIGVHLWGRGCDTESLEYIRQKYNLKLMYDSSHAFGCSANKCMIGSFGDCEVFSFHATKFINTLEGGIVTTNNKDLADRIRRMTNFGFTDYDCVDYLGINGKMNEICAAMGITNLESLEDIILINKNNYESYCNELSAIKGISIIHYDPSETLNYQYIVIELDSNKCKYSRDTVVEKLHSNNIIARKYFWPGCHKMEPYRSSGLLSNSHLPVTEYVAERVIVLPTGQAVNDHNIRHICSTLRNILES